jgi:CheY-like chemotaxis protein
MSARPILVVDDDPDIRELVTLILQGEGYAVRVACHGVEALALIEQEPPACLLLDMRMPLLDGWGVAQALQGRGSRLPIVTMTAARDARRWAEEIGADAYLAKPFDLDDLLTTVARFSDRPGPAAAGP